MWLKISGCFSNRWRWPCTIYPDNFGEAGTFVSHLAVEQGEFAETDPDFSPGRDFRVPPGLNYKLFSEPVPAQKPAAGHRDRPTRRHSSVWMISSGQRFMRRWTGCGQRAAEFNMSAWGADALFSGDIMSFIANAQNSRPAEHFRPWSDGNAAANSNDLESSQRDSRWLKVGMKPCIIIRLGH